RPSGRTARVTPVRVVPVPCRRAASGHSHTRRPGTRPTPHSSVAARVGARPATRATFAYGHARCRPQRRGTSRSTVTRTPTSAARHRLRHRHPYAAARDGPRRRAVPPGGPPTAACPPATAHPPPGPAHPRRARTRAAPTAAGRPGWPSARVACLAIHNGLSTPDPVRYAVQYGLQPDLEGPLR